MNIDNIEKCQMLLDQRANLQKAASVMADLERHAQVTIQGFARGAEAVTLYDEELNLAIQDAIDARLQAIDRRIETL